MTTKTRPTQASPTDTLTAAQKKQLAVWLYDQFKASILTTESARMFYDNAQERSAGDHDPEMRTHHEIIARGYEDWLNIKFKRLGFEVFEFVMKHTQAGKPPAKH